MKTIVSLIILILSWSTYVILDAVMNQPEPIRQPTWEPPDIPICDKELWDRIREGCEDMK